MKHEFLHKNQINKNSKKGVSELPFRLNLTIWSQRKYGPDNKIPDTMNLGKSVMDNKELVYYIYIEYKLWECICSRTRNMLQAVQALVLPCSLKTRYVCMGVHCISICAQMTPDATLRTAGDLQSK